MKSSEVSIKTRSTPASLSFKGQATKHITIKWSIRDHTIVLLALQWPSYLVSSSKESSSLSSSPSLGKSSCDFLEAKKIVILKKKEELPSNINHELSF